MDTELIHVIQQRLHRKCKILFKPEDPWLLSLNKALEGLSRRESVAWAFECCLPLIDSPELQEAYELVEKWARGEVKMPQAKQAILSIHRLAREAQELNEELRLRAIAQGLSTVHTSKHAIGLPLYYLSSLVHRSGIVYPQVISATIAKYQQTIEDIKQRDLTQTPWANFLT